MEGVTDFRSLPRHTGAGDPPWVSVTLASERPLQGPAGPPSPLLIYTSQLPGSPPLLLFSFFLLGSDF